MCKFNQNLFTVFLLWSPIWLAIFQAIDTAPLDYLLLDDFSDDDPINGGDYDMTFDQRQNGTENLRVRVNGVLIAFPKSVSSSAGSVASSVAANYLLQLAETAEDDDNNDNDDNENFNPEDYLSILNGIKKNTNAVTSSSITGEKLIETANKDEKFTKKKPTAAPSKDNELKRVTIAKDNVAIKYENSDIPKSTVVIEGEQPKPDVVPVKKIQSRRRNKYGFDQI